ncbi:hypothetical protein BHE74_00030511, partial [Ensete ventricosum]
MAATSSNSHIHLAALHSPLSYIAAFPRFAPGRLSSSPRRTLSPLSVASRVELPILRVLFFTFLSMFWRLSDLLPDWFPDGFFLGEKKRYLIDMANADLAVKSSCLRTARPLTWPNQRNWSTGCTKDTRCRTVDLAQVRSATPTCRRTPHHQYGRHGERRGSM